MSHFVTSVVWPERGAVRPEETDASNRAGRSPADTFELLGTVVHKELEGGFFAIEAGDGRTYDPIDLPEPFQTNDEQLLMRDPEQTAPNLIIPAAAQGNTDFILMMVLSSSRVSLGLLVD